MCVNNFCKPASVLLAVAGLLAPATAACGAWLPGWDYRQLITVQPTITPGDLTEFPLLVEITDATNPVFAEAASGAGLDVVFTASDGKTILPREIEHFSAAGTKLDAWVKTDVSSTGPTSLYMYYKGSDVPNSTAAWNGNYKLVQHLQESGAAAASRLDSTSNLNHGTPYSSSTITDLHTATGKINGADAFDGSDDRVQVVENGSLDITNAVTIEAWIHPKVSKVAEMFIKGTSGSAAAYEFFQSSNDSVYWRLNNNSKTIASSNKIAINDWNHVAATYDPALPSANMKLFVNGVQSTTTGDYTATLVTNDHPFAIGAQPSDAYPFNGTIDEVRISDTARSADWIKASYNNQSDPSSVSARFPEPEAWLNGWTYRQAITISKDATDGNLTDFPALVKMSGTDSNVFARANSPDGHDVVFTSGDGTTPLFHEMEHYDNTSGSESLCAWVKTPLAADRDTTIFMYYGGPSSGDPSSTDTWDPGYVMVQHLQESGATAESRLDSTGNGNDGTPYRWTKGPPAANDIVDLHTDDGLVDGADAFYGVGTGTSATESRRLQVADDTTLDTPVNEMTVEFWIRPDDQTGVLTMKGDANNATTPFELWRYSSNDSINARFKLTDGSTTTTVQTNYSNVLTADDWHYVVATFDGSLADGNVKLYIDNILRREISTGSSSIDLTGLWLPTNGSPVVMGSYPGGLYPFYGVMDEYRLSNIARTGDWLAASWRLINTPGNYLDFGPEVYIPEPGSVVLLALGGLCLAGYARRQRKPGNRA